jgi:hypothetical protein
MAKLIYLLFLLVLASTSKAQHGDSIRRITLKAKITDVDGVITRTYVHSVSDTAMFIMLKENYVYSNVDPGSLIQVKPQRIDVVSVRRKNQTSRGLGYGALAGAILGGAAGLATYQSTESGFDLGAGASGIAGVLVGGAIGGLAGVALSIGSHKYTIHGKHKNYIEMQKKINNRISKKKKAVPAANQ